MIRFKQIVFLSILLLLFQACTGKLLKEESAFIVLKTPKIKYADMGFIRNNSYILNIEMYAAGQPLVNIEVNGKNICMSTFECMSKKLFNKKILSEYYPETLLEDVFRSKPIFDKEGYEKSGDGFVQKIKKENQYDISYKVTSKTRVFRDTINKILIKVREE